MVCRGKTVILHERIVSIAFNPWVLVLLLTLDLERQNLNLVISVETTPRQFGIVSSRGEFHHWILKLHLRKLPLSPDLRFKTTDVDQYFSDLVSTEMPSWGTFLRSVNFKKSTPETTMSPADSAVENQKISLFPPQIQIQRSHSSASLNLFKKRNKQSIEIIRVSDDIQVIQSSNPNRIAEQSLNSQSMSATNGLAALRINTPNSFRPSADKPHFSNMSRNTVPDERPSNVSPQSLTSIFSATLPLSTHESQSPHILTTRPSFLTLPTSDPSETFNVNIDFTKFEETKVESQPRYDPIPPKRITNHDFLFLVDDGQGIDRRAWDTICDLVSTVTKRLIPVTARDSTQLQDMPHDSPTISIRFVNNPRNIPHVHNTAQIRNIFNWVIPREIPKHHNRYHPSQKTPPANSSPLRALEHHFWNVYNEKLQKNAWVGQTPTTIILFTSSPLGNKPEDTDIFIAKYAELLNADQVPLPLISIMVVQCNSDLIVHRQLADTRRVINLEWYTPRQKPTPPQNIGRKPVAKGSMFSPTQIPEPKRRPRRDWVDIVTRVDWERVGGISAMKEIIEDEIHKGIQRRKNLQKEAAMNYLTHLGKEKTSRVQEHNKTKVDNSNYIPGYEKRLSWLRDDKFHGKIGGESDVVFTSNYHQHQYHHHHHHHRGGGAIHTGRIDYYS